MKKFILILPVLFLVFGSVSALSIDANFKKLDLFIDDSTKDNTVYESCKQYRNGQPSERKTKEYSQCYRSEINKLSMSKDKACTLKDGKYVDALQFNWNFNEDYMLQTYNVGFIKLNRKLYYIVNDHIAETDMVRTSYLFSYDCTTKKSKQYYEYSGGQELIPLWIDMKGGHVYLSKGGLNRGYTPFKIIKVDLISNKGSEFQLFDDAFIQDDGTKKLVKGSFVWSEKLVSKLVEWVENYDIDTLKKFYEGENISIDDLTNFRTYGKIGLSKVIQGKGIMTIVMPGYTITTNIDFNKKTIK